MKESTKVMSTLFIAPCLILFILGLVLPTEWSQTAPAEKAVSIQQEAQKEAQGKAIEQQLLTVTPGDFLNMNDGTICVVKKIWVDYNPDGARIVFWGPLNWNRANGNLDNTELSTRVKRIITKTDPDYPATKEKFIYQ